MELLTAPPKSLQIADLLAAEIAAGTHPVNSRLQSVRALARRFQTSNQVIVSAFDRLEKRRLVHRRMGSGTFVLPPPNPTPLYGVFSDFQRDTFTEYFTAVTKNAVGQQCLYTPVEPSKHESWDRDLQRALTRGLDGLFVDWTGWQSLDAIEASCASVPTCFVNRWDWPQPPTAPAVLVNYSHMAQTAISYLRHRHRRIAFIGPYRRWWVPGHNRSVVAAAETLGMTFPSDDLPYCSVRDFDHDRERVANIFGTDDHPTAIFGSTDHLTLTFYERLCDMFPQCAGCELMGVYDTHWSQRSEHPFHSFAVDFDTLYADAFQQLALALRGEETEVVWHQATLRERPNGDAGGVCMP